MHPELFVTVDHLFFGKSCDLSIYPPLRVERNVLGSNLIGFLLLAATVGLMIAPLMGFPMISPAGTRSQTAVILRVSGAG
jgi:hypothetical protein